MIDLVLCHYPIFSWKNKGKGTLLLYGHTHNNYEDEYYQKCLSLMTENECRHINPRELRIQEYKEKYGSMRLYLNDGNIESGIVENYSQLSENVCFL